MPLSDAKDIKRAGDLGLCRGTLKTIRTYLEINEKDGTADGYWLDKIRERVDFALDNTESFIGE